MLDTDWLPIPADGPGLAAPGPMDPEQCFRVRRRNDTILLDLSGLRLDTTKQGLARLGRLPAWAAPAVPQPLWYVNDAPGTLHPSLIAVHQGLTLYWTGMLARGVLTVQRPAMLAGGLEYTTLTPFPMELTNG